MPMERADGQEAAEPQLKRRRLVGKQPPPHGLQDRSTRNRVQTWVRDRWVASQMSLEGAHGKQRRAELRVAFTHLETKSEIILQYWRDLPQHFLAAAQALRDTWGAGEPLDGAERQMNSYRGNGTMLRFSGSFSRITDAAAAQVCKGHLVPRRTQLPQCVRCCKETSLCWPCGRSFDLLQIVLPETFVSSGFPWL